MQGIVTSGRDESALDSRSRDNSNRRMDGIESKIEIFKPFGEAFELTKKILFQPFNFEKWLIIGFAAFLAYLNGGGFGGFRFPGSSNWAKRVSPQSENVRSFIDQLGPAWWSVIGIGILLVIAIVVILTWVRARGHFVFIDCIVRNRGAIVQPWKEYRTEGNSYFVFSLLLILGIVSLVIAVALIVFVPAFIISRHEHSGLAFWPLVLLPIILPLMFVFVTLVQFVAPLMYRRRCSAWPACTDLLSLFGKHLGIFVLYFLFSIVMGVAIAIGVVMVICMTCCIAAIPYVGTVILLPAYVFVQSFSLLFLRQFGPDYDVWQAMAQPEMPIAPPPQIPPSAPPLPP
jgi:hypothetical protein